MELLITGLILVALMAYASTRIKKRAAEAYLEEKVETDDFTIRKPEGFLHVVGDDEHAFRAYSKDYGIDDNAQHRRATIEVDAFPGESVQDIVDGVRAAAARAEIDTSSENISRIETEETANGIAVTGFYKIVGTSNNVFRLRFATLAEHTDEYLRRIDDTLDSFTTS